MGRYQSHRKYSDFFQHSNPQKTFLRRARINPHIIIETGVWKYFCTFAVLYIMHK